MKTSTLCTLSWTISNWRRECWKFDDTFVHFSQIQESMSASSVDAAASGTSPSTTRTACLLYISLCIYRILNALLIQTQFDPDEYWQTLEPAYCEAFPERHQCAFTWEWLRRSPDDAKWWMHPFEGPIRSYLSVIPTYLLYVAIRKWQLDEMWTWVVPRGPVLLNAVLVAAPTDLATWYIGQWVGSPRSPVCVDTKRRYTLAYCCLLCSVISWFNSYALIRTYSNSTETMLLTVALALVSPVSAKDWISRHHLIWIAYSWLMIHRTGTLWKHFEAETQIADSLRIRPWRNECCDSFHFACCIHSGGHFVSRPKADQFTENKVPARSLCPIWPCWDYPVLDCGSSLVWLLDCPFSWKSPL